MAESRLPKVHGTPMLARFLNWLRPKPTVGATTAVTASSAQNSPVATLADAADAAYQARIAAEIKTFADQVNVHDLPKMFHYWSNTYLRPMMESLGYSYPEDFFAREIARKRAAAGRPIRVILSLIHI